MLYTIVLHIMAYLCATHGQHQHHNITEKVRIAEMLLDVCPHTSICRNNVTTIKQDDSCCAACSCEADCGLDVPCCYTDNRDQYRARVECLLPQSKPSGGKTDAKYQPMYYMVGDISENRGKLDKSNKGRCEDAVVAPWGSIYPVTSKSTGFIYLNAVCAEKNKVTDFQLLEAHVVCTSDEAYDESSRSIAGYREWPGSCVVYFNVDTEVFAGQKCGLTDMISACPINFEVPSYTNLSRNQIMEGCASGLLSPYYTVRGYVNPFCMMCRSDARESQCSDKNRSSRYLGVSMYYLLDITLAVRGKWALYVPTHDVRYAVVEACLPATKHAVRNETVCREVRCPSGQVRNMTDGTCFFPAKKWYTDGFTIYLKLIPTESTFVSFNDTIEPSKLESPWPNSWYISEIFAKLIYDNVSYYDIYEAGNRSDYDAYYGDYGIEHRTIIPYLIVRLSNNETHVKPNAFIKKVETFLDTNWIYMTDSGPVEMQSSLAIYNRWQHVLNNNLVIPTAFSKKFDDYWNELLTIMYDTENIVQRATVLSRLNFCERLRLLPHDFYLTEDMTLYYIYRDTFLMDGEYTLAVSSNGERSAYICLSDSSFVKNEIADYDIYNAASRRSNNNIEYVAMLLVIMYVMFNNI